MKKGHKSLYRNLLKISLAPVLLSGCNTEAPKPNFIFSWQMTWDIVMWVALGVNIMKLLT